MASLPGKNPSNNFADTTYVGILDTTLRDGKQTPGGAMTAVQKLAVARSLVLLGVDVIDAGFPASSQEDFDAVKNIAAEVGSGSAGENGRHVPVVAAIARCCRKDIDAAWAALRGARRPRISTFIATSEIHMKHKLTKSREEVLAIAAEMVAYARSVGCEDVGFCAEDSLRSDKDFLCQVFGEVIKAGATTLIIADTVGCSLPSEIGGLGAYVRAHIPGIENAIVSVHCHNDLGLANANTRCLSLSISLTVFFSPLMALSAGHRGRSQGGGGHHQRYRGKGWQCSPGGGGEVFFITNSPVDSLNSCDIVVMAIKCRKDMMGGIYTGINTRYISATSKIVAENTGLNVQPHKAIVGANAFSHESGIHQDGVLKYRGTYEFISREDIGLDQTSEPGIVLGKLRICL